MADPNTVWTDENATDPTTPFTGPKTSPTTKCDWERPADNKNFAAQRYETNALHGRCTEDWDHITTDQMGDTRTTYTEQP